MAFNLSHLTICTKRVSSLLDRGCLEIAFELGSRQQAADYGAVEGSISARTSTQWPDSISAAQMTRRIGARHLFEIRPHSGVERRLFANGYLVVFKCVGNGCHDASFTRSSRVSGSRRRTGAALSTRLPSGSTTTIHVRDATTCGAARGRAPARADGAPSWPPGRL